MAEEQQAEELYGGDEELGYEDEIPVEGAGEELPAGQTTEVRSTPCTPCPLAIVADCRLPFEAGVRSQPFPEAHSGLHALGLCCSPPAASSCWPGAQ